MAKQQLNDTQLLNDEFTRIFDAYRARIDEITHRTERNLDSSGSVDVATTPAHPPVRQAPESAISRITPRVVNRPQKTPVSPPPVNKVDIAPAFSPPVNKIDVPTVFSPPVNKPDIEYISSPPAEKIDIQPVSSPPTNKPDVPSVVKLELPVVKESEAIVKEAKRKAQRIIDEADDIIKKEAKKKTQAYVEKIITSAQKEAEDIINKAAQSVDRERAEALSLLKQESERVSREIKEKYAQENRQHSAHIIAEAREQAAVILKDIVNNSTEIGRQMDDTINRAKKTVAEFETRLREDTVELSKAISETQNKLLQVTMVPVKEDLKPESSKPESPKPESLAIVRNREASKNPAMSVHLSSDNTREKYLGGGLFSGQVEMKSASASFDYQYLKNLKKYLVHIPNIKYIQESASEREVSVLFDIKEPLPLLDILNHIPIIDEVITETNDDICLIFKNAE